MSAVGVTNEVGCEGVDAQHKVIKPQHFDDGHHYDVAGVEWVDGFEFHAHFELKRTWGCARGILGNNGCNEALVISSSLSSSI